MSLTALTGAAQAHAYCTYIGQPGAREPRVVNDTGVTTLPGYFNWENAEEFRDGGILQNGGAAGDYASVSPSGYSPSGMRTTVVASAPQDGEIYLHIGGTTVAQADAYCHVQVQNAVTEPDIRVVPGRHGKPSKVVAVFERRRVVDARLTVRQNGKRHSVAADSAAPEATLSRKVKPGNLTATLSLTADGFGLFVYNGLPVAERQYVLKASKPKPHKR